MSLSRQDLLTSPRHVTPLHHIAVNLYYTTEILQYSFQIASLQLMLSRSKDENLANREGHRNLLLSLDSQRALVDSASSDQQGSTELLLQEIEVTA